MEGREEGGGSGGRVGFRLKFDLYFFFFRGGLRGGWTARIEGRRDLGRRIWGLVCWTRWWTLETRPLTATGDPC